MKGTSRSNGSSHAKLGTLGRHSPTATVTADTNDSKELKRTFKEKMYSMIQEAESVKIKAVREEELQDRKSLSISMLKEGRPHAFIDFFQLTQASRPDSTDDTQHAASASSSELPSSVLLLMKQEMVRADAASTAGDYEQVFDAYRHLGRFFSQTGHLVKAIFFFEKCLQVSMERIVIHTSTLLSLLARW